MKKAWKIISKTFTVFLIILTFSLMSLAAYNFVSVKILNKDYPNLFGYTFFEIISGSMSPTIEKGDMILVKLDTDYNVGDIISFKDNGTIITHRIIEINDNNYVTKGDANNTADNPIKENQIIGKTVKIASRAFILAKVFTTPKVMLMCLITITLICWCVSSFKNEVKKEKMKTNGRIDIMDIIKKNNRLKLEIAILLILLAMLCFLIPFTLSRFRTEARGNAPIDIAFYLLNDTYTRQNITLDEMKPGDEKSYTFSVSNTDGTNRSEVTLDYEILIRTTTNLQLEYELDEITTGTDLDVVLSSNTVTDDDGTYFKEIKTSSETFAYTSDQTKLYKLTIKYPSSLKDHKNQVFCENIEINSLSKQKI